MERGATHRDAETASAAALLERHGQQHLLNGIGDLPPDVRDGFVSRLLAIDWDELARVEEPPRAEAAEPIRVVTLDELRARQDELRPLGESAYARDAVAVLIVAGGQGTRLGFAGPKGCFPLAPHTQKTIYQLQAEKVVSLARRLGRPVRLLVLTSDATDAQTREFFERHGWFGLGPRELTFFVQDALPSVDREGRALLAAPGRLLENPDGHGGTFGALIRAGLLDELLAAGTEWIVYVQVDNVLAPVDDPLLVGLAASEQADVVTKVLEKTHPDEKVGNLVRIGGRDRIVEYTELTPERARTRVGGELLYRWGSPAMHCWSTDFLTRLARRGYRPPLHRSPKPLKAWVGGRIQEIDGWKCERFIFDLVSEADRNVAMEIDRAAEFAPVKNAEGPDSPATAVAAMHAQYVSWLEAAGVDVSLPRGALVEISPLLAATRAQFLERWDGRLAEVTEGCYLE